MGFFSRTSSGDQRSQSPIRPTPSSSNAAAATHPASHPGNNVVSLLRNKWKNRNRDQNSSPPKPPAISLTQARSNELSQTPQTLGGEHTSANPGNRQSTDALTLTLAQRLGELATANGDGLLDDHEYRILRQSVFDRFAGSEAVPSEASIIPHSSPGALVRARSKRKTESESRPASTANLSMASNSPSLISQFGSIVRRGSKRSRSALNSSTASPRNKRDAARESDVSSVLSHPQQFSNNRRASASFTRPVVIPPASHVLSHSLSSSSMRNISFTSYSRAGGSSSWQQSSDTKSISSMRTGHTARSAHAPSSFRLGGHGSLPSTSALDPSIYDEGDLKTSVDIKAAITELEKEMRGLMDAFKGLELSIQVTSQDGSSQSRDPYSGLVTPLGSTVSLTTEEGIEMSPRKPISRSHISRSTSRGGRNRSPFPIGRSPINHAAHPSQSSSVSHNVTLEGLSQPSVIATPPSPDTRTATSELPITHSTPIPQVHKFKTLPSPPIERPALSTSNSSTSIHVRAVSVARKRSGTLASHTSQVSGSMIFDMVPSDSGIGGLVGNDELAEVRRRRAEVGRRYEARLDFLRAKLKGVEMREKLSRT